MKDPDFFVVGLQKSGTFWVTALLNAHPEIRSFPSTYGGYQTNQEVEEGRVFDMLASIEHDGGIQFRQSFLNHHGGYFSDLVPLLETASRRELFERFRDRYREWCDLHSKGKRLVGDKTTEYVFHLDLIDSFYPNVKKLCILRDPKDRVVSWHFMQIRKKRKDPGPITDKCILEYIRNRVIKEYESMIAYKGGLKCFTYERLSARPDEVLSEILAYLEAESNAEIISRMQEGGSLDSLRRADPLSAEARRARRDEMILSSHYRRGIVGDWKNWMSEAQAKLIDAWTSRFHADLVRKYGFSGLGLT